MWNLAGSRDHVFWMMNILICSLLCLAIYWFLFCGYSGISYEKRNRNILENRPFVPLIKLREQMAFGFPESLVKMKYVNMVMALSSVILVLLSINLWMRKKSNIWFKAYYTLFSLITLSYVLLLYRWHFLMVTVWNWVHCKQRKRQTTPLNENLN